MEVEVSLSFDSATTAASFRKYPLAISTNITWYESYEVPVWMRTFGGPAVRVFYSLQRGHIGTCTLSCMTVVVGKGNLLIKCS